MTVGDGRRRLPCRSRVNSLKGSFQGAAIRDLVIQALAPVPDPSLIYPLVRLKCSLTTTIHKVYHPTVYTGVCVV